MEEVYNDRMLHGEWTEEDLAMMSSSDNDGITMEQEQEPYESEFLLVP